jgi:elongation factor G
VTPGNAAGARRAARIDNAGHENRASRHARPEPDRTTSSHERKTIMSSDISRIRNIGISAHIDSGKTTLTERILYYTKKIHAMHDVKGKDGVGAKMDSMDLERERGITIQSAATYCAWGAHHINIIDTPGHVDFTVEVERSLRVLDGAVLVLCSVAGVQSQSITVDRQMRRYNVPRLAFVNKCDRSGANPKRVAQQLIDKLKHHAVMMQLPIGLEGDHVGVIDLVTMQAVYFDGEKGDDIRREEIPAALLDEAKAAREHMLEEVSHFSDELMEAILEGKEIADDLIHEAVRRGTLTRELTPVFLGSAYKNKGVQLLLDAVTRYLPSPLDKPATALDLSSGEKPMTLEADPTKPLVSLAFKLTEERYGQLTYIRVYRGTLGKSDSIVNMRTKRRVKVGRLVRMHSDEMEDIDRCNAGDIVALFGIDCQSGDTFVAEGVEIAMTSMFVPTPVMHLSIKPADSKAEGNMTKALGRFTKEDPTFRVKFDDDSGETVISGMGELHLDVYVERMKREYNAEVEVGRPKVAYRETITQLAEFDYAHKKQTGGSGQYGRVCGFMEPNPEADYEFVNDVRGGAIPSEFIPACDKGFQSMLKEGPLIQATVVNIKITINDGNSHAVDSSDIAFQQAAHGAFKQAYERAKAIVLEPIMKLSVEGPAELQGGILRTIMQRRGVIIGTTEEEGFTRVDAHIPLSEMFGYSTDLRSATQGKAEFTLEFERYAAAPRDVQEKLVQEAQARRAAKNK